jgi:hypothetical protein
MHYICLKFYLFFFYWKTHFTLHCSDIDMNIMKIIDKDTTLILIHRKKKGGGENNSNENVYSTCDKYVHRPPFIFIYTFYIGKQK